MMRTRSLCLLAVSTLCLAVAPAAGALGSATATKTTKRTDTRPTVTSVAPLKLAVGDLLTIKGRNFVAGRKRNTVVFKRDGKPSVFVKAATASRTVIKVVVPSTLAPYFAVRGGTPIASRFRIRVLAKRFGLRFTATRMSPVIGPGNVARDTPAATPGTPGAAGGAPATPAQPTPVAPPPDCDGDGTPDASDPDDDDDRLSDALEVALKTAPCNRDSDFDGNEDGWEYYSALDLNTNGQPPLPYPGKRPYPNPLDGGDAGTDYDGDGLRAHQEHALWQSVNRPLPLNYSDGTQFSGPPVPAPTNPALAHLNIPSASDGPRDAAELSDDEKDHDGDRLGNGDESFFRMMPGWWPANYEGEDQFSPFYQHLGQPMYATVDYLDPDSDGDGIRDGDDDQDHDGWNNVAELNRGPWMVHEYNPCLPDYTSPTCPRFLAEGDNPYAPFTMSWPQPNPVPWP